jgi:hypothetical protein
MTLLPPGVKVHLAFGFIDTLAMLELAVHRCHFRSMACDEGLS